MDDPGTRIPDVDGNGEADDPDIGKRLERDGGADDPSTGRELDGDGRANKPGIGRKQNRQAIASDAVRASLFFLYEALFFMASFSESETVGFYLALFIFDSSLSSSIILVKQGFSSFK